MNKVFLFLSLFALMACSKKAVHNANDLRDALADSLEASMEGNRLSQTLPGLTSVEVRKTQEERMLSLIDQSTHVGESIDPKFLAWLHKDLPDLYINKLIEGQKLYTQGIRESNVTLQLNGNALMAEWQKFWAVHGVEIWDKMYPE